VEERLSPHRYVEGNVRIRFAATRVVLLVLSSWNAQKVPLDARVEILQVDSILDCLSLGHSAGVLPQMLQVNLDKQCKIVGIVADDYQC